MGIAQSDGLVKEYAKADLGSDKGKAERRWRSLLSLCIYHRALIFIYVFVLRAITEGVSLWAAHIDMTTCDPTIR